MRRVGAETSRSLGRDCVLSLDDTDIAVPCTVHGLDMSWYVGVISKGAASQRNHAVQRRGRDIAVPPDGIQQLVPSDKGARPGEQLQNDRKYFGFEDEFRTSARKTSIPRIDVRVAAAIPGRIQFDAPRALGWPSDLYPLCGEPRQSTSRSPRSSEPNDPDESVSPNASQIPHAP